MIVTPLTPEEVAAELYAARTARGLDGYKPLEKPIEIPLKRIRPQATLKVPRFAYQCTKCGKKYESKLEPARAPKTCKGCIVNKRKLPRP
jgi:hypothetical protein